MYRDSCSDFVGYFVMYHCVNLLEFLRNPAKELTYSLGKKPVISQYTQLVECLSYNPHPWLHLTLW